MIKPAFDGDIKGNKIDWGKEFRLSTRVSGNPKPKVKWMKDGVEVKDGENGVKLVSDDVTGQSTYKELSIKLKRHFRKVEFAFWFLLQNCYPVKIFGQLFFQKKKYV